VVHVGDLVANGNNPDDWDRFFEIEKDLLRNAPFYPVLGNHERNTPLFSKYFAFPDGNPHHYSFDWGAAHIVALDTNEVGPTDAVKSAFLQYELAWLQDDLQRNEKPLTFVVFHHPLYTVVKGRRAAAAKLASKIEPILLAGGVTAVFSGHDHNYQHHLKSGLHHVVTGGGGAPLYDVDPIPEVTVKAMKVENYVRVRVQGKKARVEALDLEGNLLESFQLRPRAKPKSDALP
jgi:3',5'-cyclic AMP phosphodiesterase CpdA